MVRSSGSIQMADPRRTNPVLPMAPSPIRRLVLWPSATRKGLYFDAVRTDTLTKPSMAPRARPSSTCDQEGCQLWLGPKITYGGDLKRHDPFNEREPEAEGMEQPMTYWVPSIAPSGPDQADERMSIRLEGRPVHAAGMNGPPGLRNLVRHRHGRGKVAGPKDLLTGDDAASRSVNVIQGPDGHSMSPPKDMDGIFRVDVAE